MAMVVTPSSANPGSVELPISGATVGRLIVDAALTLQFVGDGPEYTLRIEADFTLILEDEEAHIQMSPGGLGPALSLMGKEVAKAVAEEDGSLTIAFSDQTRLFVATDADYEPWNFVGDDGFRLVSLPGGGLAKWSSRPA